MFLYCLMHRLLLLAVSAWRSIRSFIKLWPYDLSFSLRHYTFGLVDGGVDRRVFQQPEDGAADGGVRHGAHLCGAYLIEKTRGMPSILRALIRLLARLPMGVPGMVLGLGYILFFNSSGQSAQWSLLTA